MSAEEPETEKIVKPETEQILKADDLKLLAFLLARGCRVKDSKSREDNRVDFFVGGPTLFDLVKEYDMKSPNTLVSVHEYTASMEHVRDIITRVKRSNPRPRR